MRILPFLADTTSTRGAAALSDPIKAGFTSFFPVIQVSKTSATERRIVYPFIDIKLFFDEKNFGNGTTIPAIPISGRVAGSEGNQVLASSGDGKKIVVLQVRTVK